MSNIPADLRFQKSHEWARLEADGTITIGNADLGGQPELINSDPYGAGWIMRVRPTDKAQFASMLDAKAYAAALAAETH